MGSSTNTLPSTSTHDIQDCEHLNALNTNVSSFISVKLSGNHNYHLWKAQMLCLLDSNNMCGIVDAAFVVPRDYGSETMRQYDNIVKGWIFSSVSEDVLAVVFNLISAKVVWEKLKSIYEPTMCLQIDAAPKGSDAKKETEDMDVVLAERNTIEEGTNLKEIIVPVETKTINKDMQKKIKHEKLGGGSKKKKNKNVHSGLHKTLCKFTVTGDWSKAESLIKRDKNLVTKAISSDGSMMLHLAVGIGHNDFVKKLLLYMNDEQVLTQRDPDGSTALHIAAIVGNRHAADLLVKKNKKLLRIKDKNYEEPLHKAYENMHLDTIGYLLKAVKDDGITELQYSLTGYVHHDDEIGVRLVVNAISAKQYSLASELVQDFPNFASKMDDVLVAIAKTFPSGLDHWETLIYPSVEEIQKKLRMAAASTVHVFAMPAIHLFDIIIKSENYHYTDYILLIPKMLLAWLASAFMFICLLVLIIVFIFNLLDFTWWKAAKILAFGPINHIENKKKEWDEAKKLLELVCDEIDELDYSGTHHPHYTRPLLEAACQNAYKVVDEILFRSPEAIQSKDKSGYDIIQLAIINRSEKIYNLIYDIGERRNLYRTYKDSSENNILHLAGKLAPSSVLNQRTGAALQLQRELQWCEEVKKLVFPTYITQENIFKETPDMVFTREHKELVKEGEQWMKTTAESCSIAAALITTIVFAAAITVPGGSNQEKGTPLFKKKSAFIVFAISDAISLFASSTALLVFLSILTARFSEKDFLLSLPRRLFIGLFSLLLSTTAMMVAFSATLFLVFCDEKPWMLAPICGLAFIPIAVFVGLQFPLMVDLFKSTYLRIFGKHRKSVLRRFDPDDIRLRFGK